MFGGTKSAMTTSELAAMLQKLPEREQLRVEGVIVGLALAREKCDESRENT